MFTDGLVHDIDYYINQYSPIEVTPQKFPEEKEKGLFYFTGNLRIDENTEQIEYYYYSDDDFTQTYDHETIPVVRDGISTVRVREYYARSSSKEEAPTTWYTTPPEYTGVNKYLWNYEVSVLSDGAQIQTDPVVISENGKGIKSIQEYYGISNSTSVQPSNWNTTPQIVSSGNKYLWNYEVVTYDDNTTSQTAPAIIGTYGEQGLKGDTGSSAPKYVGPYNNSNIPAGNVEGDTYLNVDTKKMYIWRNNDWSALSDQDTAWWAAMGDAINYASSTGQSIDAANIWVGKLVAGTILADSIKTKILTADNIKAISGVFQDITVSGTVNANAGEFTGSEYVSGVFGIRAYGCLKNSGITLKDNDVRIYARELDFIHEYNNSTLHELIRGRIDFLNNSIAKQFYSLSVFERIDGNFRCHLQNQTFIDGELICIQYIRNGSEFSTDTYAVYFRNYGNVYRALFRYPTVTLYMISPSASGSYIFNVTSAYMGETSDPSITLIK